MRQGSLSEGRLGEGSRLRQLLQDLLQVLGDFSKRGTGAGFHAAAVDGQKQERQRAVISHQCSKSRHIQAKVLSAGQVVRVGRYSGNEFTEDNPKGEDVSLFIIQLSPQHLWSHPVWGAHHSQRLLPCPFPIHRNLFSQSEITHDSCEASVFPSDQTVLGCEVSVKHTFGM